MDFATVRHAVVRYQDAHALVEALDADLSVRYDGEGSSPVEGADFLPPYGIFLVASVDGGDVACGGLRLLKDGVGEVKRMYTSPSARGRGVARALLRALVEHARAVGLDEVWLETGTMQPEAIALYESEGFSPIAPYGYYKNEPLSRCYRLMLS